MNTVDWLDDAWQDLRHAVRIAAPEPWFRGGGYSFARARDRREYSDFPAAGCGAPAQPAGSRSAEDSSKCESPAAIGAWG